MAPIVTIAGAGFDAVHLILAALVLAAGGALFWLRIRAREVAIGLRHELSAARAELERFELQAGEAETALRETQARCQTLERDLAVAQARGEDDRKAFAAMAQDAVRAAHQTFLERANETFEKHKSVARSDLEKLMTPIGETFAEFRKRVETIEQVRTEHKTALEQQIRAISDGLKHNTSATSKLVSALSAPRGGGNWGEESLRNVMELAGMSAYADFTEQSHEDTENGRLRPDVIIRMPGGREIVVDAKVSMEDYLRASDEPDEAQRRQYLGAHARKLRDHVQRLSRKEYWKPFEGRVDFVAMYVPGEQFYSAALEVDRDLFDYAARSKVLIVTPSTLIALAKAVAYGWRQEEAARNAHEAAKLGEQLYDRLAVMSGHIEKLGKSLNNSVEHFNKMNRSLETRVLPSARRFQDLQIAGPDKAIPHTEPIEARAALPDGTGERRFEGPRKAKKGADEAA